MIINTFEELGRDKLRELLAQCTKGQVNVFNRMYRSVDVIPLKKINCAIQQCERTIAMNNMTYEERLKAEEEKDSMLSVEERRVRNSQ